MFALSHAGQIIRGTILLVVGVAVGGFFLVRALKRSDDPARLLFKWLLTAGVVFVIFWKVVPMVGQGGYGAAFGGIPFAAVCGLTLAIIWRQNIADIIAKPFGDIYDGGTRELDPHPVYSMANAQRKRGNYREAVAQIWKQLERFPNDFEGQLLLAEIQAENLNDLPGAEITIQRLCNQEGHAPRNIALALNYIADWHLKLTQDREAAKAALEKIIELLPDSEMSALAAQRIGHLAGTEFLLAPHDRKRIAVTPGIENIGLLPAEQQPKAPEDDPVRQASELVKHLQEHPLDTEARERLAVIYSDHYQRLDLATDQLEQLVAHPNQPAKRVVRWLNMLADLQVRHSGDYESVRKTLQRIVDLFPNSAAGETARSRLAHLRLELKGKAQGQTVKLGTYEQDIGLKRGLPREL